MPYSNTVSQTVFTTRRVIESAIRRCKLTAEQITAEYVDIAKDQLFLFLSDLANQGAPLWCIEKQIYPLYDGVGTIALDIGTVDLLNSNLRYLQPVSGTDYDTSTTHTVDYVSETVVSTMGIFWTAASVPVAFEWSPDNIVWETIQEETPAAVAGQWTWYDMETVVSARYFRVRALSGTLSFDQVFMGNTPTEIPLARMNRDDYTNLPNKVFQSNRPLQFWLDRVIPRPVMYLWPIPNAQAETSQIVVWRQRHIMDVGTLTQEIEVPQRWLEAIVSGLAAKMALELPEASAKMIPILDAKADKALAIAQAEERDNSPIMWAPNISMYTR